MAIADPQQLRWVIAPDDFSTTGTVRQASGRFGALLESGVIEQLVVRIVDVLITLSIGSSWSEIDDQPKKHLSTRYCTRQLDGSTR
ncbi:hypothetical protein ABFA25_14075 [Mycobacterium lepromatosis]|nr:hypothetical protein [Mycobacterium lepromatosis]